MPLLLHKHAALRLAIALAVVGIGVALRLALEPWLSGRLPYVTVFGSVALAVWLAGAAPATLAAVAGFAAVNAFVADHPGSESAGSPGFWIALTGFTASAGLIVFFGAWTQRELARRRAAESAANGSSVQLEATLASIGDGVIVTDLRGRVQSLNQAAQALTGWTSEAARDEPIERVVDLLDEDTQTPLDNPAMRALAEGRTLGPSNHTLLRARDGLHKPIDGTAAPVRRPDGQVLGVVLVLRDMAERRRQQRALRDSEALLRALYEGTTTSIGVVELLDDGDILHLHDNAVTCRIFGVPPGGTANRRASELGASREMMALWLKHYGESARRGAPVSFEFQLQGPQALTWYRATVSPLPPGDHGRPRFSYLADDITAQHAAQRVVTQSEAKARMALDVARIGTWSWDPDTDVVEADERCRAIAGLPHRAALRLDDVIARIHPPDRETVARALCQAVAPGASGLYMAEFRYAHDNGGPRWVVERGQLLSEAELVADGRRLMLGTVLDITDRKQAEESVASSDRRKSEFLATLAHELRNPLAPLRSGLAVMELSDDPATRARVLPMLNRQMSLLVRLIDDLLDLSRISRDQFELRQQPLELASVLHAAIEISQPLFALHRHRLQLRLPPRPVRLVGDADRLTQLFANLLNNAAKYTPPGGTIEVSLDEADGQACVTVADDGIGIPLGMQERVFEMFAQVDRSAPATQGGLGIGLSIGRRIAQLHHGTITAHSDGEGRGSRFVVTLPSSSPATGPRSAGTAGDVPLPPARRILVVDDNVDAAQSLCQLLSLLGQSVLAAHSGPAALRLAESFAPQIVMLDIGMPGMDGHEVARRLRASDAGRSALLVALTGWGQQEDRVSSRAAGFDRHLVKPVSLDDLLETIRDTSVTQ